MENARRNEFKEKIDHLREALPTSVVDALTIDLDMDEVMANGMVQVDEDTVVIDLKKEGNSTGVFVAFEVDDAECVIQTTEILENGDSIHKGVKQRVLMTKDQKIKALEDELQILIKSDNEALEHKIMNIRKRISRYQNDDKTLYYMDNYYFDRFCDIDKNNEVIASRENMSGRDEFYDFEGNKSPDQLYTADNFSEVHEEGISLTEAINKDFSNALYLTKTYREIKQNVEVLDMEEPIRSL